VFINIVSGEGGPTLRSIYENVSKNNLFAMFVRVNLSMIVAFHIIYFILFSFILGHQIFHLSNCYFGLFCRLLTKTKHPKKLKSTL
jgi:hypothetical protein